MKIYAVCHTVPAAGGKEKKRKKHVMKNKVERQQRLPGRIILTGFRATGKTAVGQALARLTGFRFLDTDQEISQRMGCSIAESVRQHGWQLFREQERALLGELSSCQKTIIATGGGAILHHEEWQKLRQDALVIWLRTDLATTLSRLALDQKTAEQRPALKKQEERQGPAEEIAAVLAEREPLYRDGSDLLLNTQEKTPEELAGKIYEQVFLSTV